MGGRDLAPARSHQWPGECGPAGWTRAESTATRAMYWTSAPRSGSVGRLIHGRAVGPDRHHQDEQSLPPVKAQAVATAVTASHRCGRVRLWKAREPSSCQIGVRLKRLIQAPTRARAAQSGYSVSR